MKKTALPLVALILTSLHFSCMEQPRITHLPYPETRKDATVEDYHGTQVADPYRWLEDDRSPETGQWVEAQNTVTYDYLGRIPGRDFLTERLTQLWDYARMDPLYSFIAGEYYITSRNDGLQNQNVIYRQKGADGTPEVLLDPNTLSPDGTLALVTFSLSEDNKYLGYSTSQSGSDWVEINVMEIATGEKLPDVIKDVKFSGAAWSGGGFYYSRYDRPVDGSDLSAQNSNQKVYYHTLGQAQELDKLVYEDPAHPMRYLNGFASEDGKYVFVVASEGTRGTEILYKPTANPLARFEVLLPGFEYDYEPVECKDDKLWVWSNQGAANYNVVCVDLTNPKAEPAVVIPESDILLESVGAAGGYLLAEYLEKAQSKVVQFDMQGQRIREVELPGIGTAGSFGGRAKDTECLYSFANYTSPTEMYRFDLAAGTSEVFFKPELKYDPELYMTEQLFFPSKDGTMVSMFVARSKKMKLDGKNPLYLYGYGGFSNPLTPKFSPATILMMEQGAAYVAVNLRGGNEYGEEWHKAGMLENKQNVFDDFIAAAEYLIEKGYTSKEKIAIAGGSNGGLLVGACMTQRPELFAVALPAVGVMDMLRYHKFTVGWGWAVEYGSSDDPAQFEYLYKYSPLHNIKDGVCYPATLVTTADHDDRVVPAHSFKFAARLQAAQGCGNPALIRIATKAGHGAGKPTSKRIEELVDVTAFFLYNTGEKIK